MVERVKILFPTDFSDESMKAFGMAKLFAHTYNAEFFLLHVIEPPARALKLLSSFDEADARKAAVNELQKIVDANPDEKVEYIKMIKVGKAYKMILEAAKEISANAIIMGTHGDGGLHEILIGSNAGRVIRSAPCHVITLRNKVEKATVGKIVLPLDLTKETGEKVNLGIEFAQNFGASLVLMSVLVTDDQEIKARLQKRLDLAVDFVKKHGISKVESELVVTTGQIGDAVLEYSTKVNADMLLIMIQQELKTREIVMGSRAEHIVNHANIAVMCCKPKRVYKETQYSSAVFG